MMWDSPVSLCSFTQSVLAPTEPFYLSKYAGVMGGRSVTAQLHGREGLPLCMNKKC